MLNVLGITFPIFAVIAIGYGTTARGLFKPGDMRVLGAYVLNISMPALMFSAVATRDLSQIIVPGYLGAYALASLTTMAIGYAVTAALGGAFGGGPARRALGSLGMAMPNSAFVGYPVLLLSLPDIAGAVLAMNFLIENFVALPIALAVAELSRPTEGKSLFRIIGGILWQVLTRPFIVALLLGLAVSLSGIPIPEPVARGLSLVAGSAAAVALVVIGGTLFGLPLKGNKGLAGLVAAGKLLLHPAIAALIVLLLPLGLSPELGTALILTCAMPMVAIYAILAQPFGHDGMASIALLLATTASFVTITILLALLL
ncbi:AEC family transporter [Psychromarinibacter sp. S121]|uniref:AEC family transporter n=1 Tax=Psychromarinibacter sp. S121 TaxID=3415127 RepID=UPI003C7BD36F